MRNVLRLLIVFALIAATAIACEAAKKTVAVMPLENVSGYAEQRVAEIMTEQLIAALNGSGNYIVVERAQMGTVLKEQGFQSLTNPTDEAPEIAGADYTVVGKVTMVELTDTAANALAKKIFGANRHSILMNPYRGRVALNFRFVKTATGEIIFDRTVEGDKTGKTTAGAVHDACKEAAENALKEIQSSNPLSAQVAEVNGELIYIDVGLDSGLKTGETLIIVREGRPIEVNGRIVGMTQDEVGKAKVTEIHKDYSVCRVTSHSNGVRKGDVVKRGQ